MKYLWIVLLAFLCSASTVAPHQVHPELELLFLEVGKSRDFVVLTSFRPQEEQDRAYREGHSTLRFPCSKHNVSPSWAIDVIPTHKEKLTTEDWYFWAGYVKAVADKMNIKVRWGGDWDGDLNLHDNSLVDLYHWEMVEGYIPPSECTKTKTPSSEAANGLD